MDVDRNVARRSFWMNVGSYWDAAGGVGGCAALSHRVVVTYGMRMASGGRVGGMLPSDMIDMPTPTMLRTTGSKTWHERNRKCSHIISPIQ